MKTLLHQYRTPVLCTLLMVGALAFWGWQRWQSIHEFESERAHRFVSGVFDTLEGTLRALGDHGRFRRGQTESILEGLVRNSPLCFVAVEQDGRRVLQAGAIPAGISWAGESGEVFRSDVSVFWQPVRLKTPAHAQHKAVPAADPAGPFDLILDETGQKMILGVEPPRTRPWLHGPIRGLMITMVVGLLFAGATLVAWIMTIRSGLLMEQLRLERTRRAHLEELGLAAAGLAHETKNPLGIILGLAQQIARNPAEPETSRAMLEHIMDEVDKAAARLGDFMTFARQRKASVAALEIRALASRVAEVLRPDFDSLGVRLELDCAPLRILADEDMLRQILVNLLVNSLHASKAASTVAIRVARDGDCARLAVEDHGTGIAPGLLPDIFKPYVSGSAAGHGLGLAVVKRLVEEHGWKIAIESKPGAGTTVAVSGIALVPAGETKP